MRRPLACIPALNLRKRFVNYLRYNYYVAENKKKQKPAAIDEGFQEAFSRVNAALELSPLDHAEAMGLESWEVGDNSGTIEGYKGKKAR